MTRPLSTLRRLGFTPAPAPAIRKDDAGVRRLVGRRFGQMAGNVVVCPDGHRTGRTMRTGESHFALECAHAAGGDFRGRAEGSEQVHWLYLLPAAGGGTLVVECHHDEARWIATRELSLEEIRTYLGVEQARAA